MKFKIICDDVYAFTLLKNNYLAYAGSVTTLCITHTHIHIHTRAF